jgi:hypothetical protein
LNKPLLRRFKKAYHFGLKVLLTFWLVGHFKGQPIFEGETASGTPAPPKTPHDKNQMESVIPLPSGIPQIDDLTKKADIGLNKSTNINQ